MTEATKRVRRRISLMTRRRRRNRPTVIQHTSMVSQSPITVDLCSPQQIFPSCIDLTNEQDDSDEIVDLTSFASANDSIVCINQTTPSIQTVARLQERRAQRAQQHDHCYRNANLAIEVDDSNHSDTSDEVLPVFDESCKKCWNNKKTENDPSMKKIVCPICLDDITNIQKSDRQLISTVCGHIFCNVCIREAIRTHHCCPNCRKRLTVKQFHPLFI